MLNEADTNWILDTLKEHLNRGDFYGSIELNFQASRLINANIKRSLKPEKRECDS